MTIEHKEITHELTFKKESNKLYNEYYCKKCNINIHVLNFYGINLLEQSYSNQEMYEVLKYKIFKNISELNIYAIKTFYLLNEYIDVRASTYNVDKILSSLKDYLELNCDDILIKEVIK